jgi:hypothetical protein
LGRRNVRTITLQPKDIKLHVRLPEQCEITEQRPDERVAWKATSGTKNDGVVTFHRLGDGRTRVMLQLEFDPEGFVESAGDLLGVVHARTAISSGSRTSSKRGFKTGAWRGEIHQDPTR